MSQIKIFRDGVDVYDLGIDTDTEHLALDDTEETAVLIALTTERRAPANLAIDPADPRGWWGETYLEDGQLFGSLLWTLKGRGMTADTMSQAEQFTRDALKRWLDAGYLLTFEIASEAPNTFRMKVRLERPDSTIVANVPLTV